MKDSPALGAGVASDGPARIRLEPGGRQALLAPADVPDLGGPVVAGGEDELAVGREGHTIQVESMAHRQADRRAGGGVPEAGVGDAGRDRPAVGRERHDSDRAVLAERKAGGAAEGRVPDPRRAATIEDDDQPAVGREDRPPGSDVIMWQFADESAGGGLPEPYGPISARRDDHATIAREADRRVPKRRPGESSRGDIDQPGLIFVAAHQEEPAVRQEPGARGDARPDRRADRPSGRGIPEPHREVAPIPGQEEPSTGCELEAPDRTAVGERRAGGLAGLRVPGPYLAVVAAGHHPSMIRRERGTKDPVGVREGRSDRAAGRRVPQPGRAVGAGGQDGTAVGAEHGSIERAAMLEDRAEARRPGLPGGDVGARHAGEIGALGRCVPEGFGHPERPEVAVSRPRQVEAAVEVARGGLGLGPDAQGRLGRPRLGLGDGHLAGPGRRGIGPAPEHGDRREARQEHRDQAGE